MTQTTRNQPSLIRSGGWPFVLTGLIGRMPAATLQLGLLMYVTGSGLGFGLGGLTVAAVGLGTAAGAPIVGRLADRFGPFWIVAVTLCLQTVGLFAIMTVVSHTPHPALVLLCAAMIGASNPQVGPISRAHWSLLARRQQQPDLVRVALGYEGAADETSFVIGPAVASVLVGWLGPNPALWVLLVFTWVGEGVFLAFLWGRRKEPIEVAVSTEDAAGRLSASLLVWPLLGCLAVGMVFGTTQTTVTAVMSSAGLAGISGPVYACVGIGSAITSIIVVRLRLSLGAKIIAGGVVIAVGEITMRILDSPVLAAVGALVIGMAVGFVLVSAFSAIERVAPSDRINQAMTFGATSLTLGISVGAGVAGLLVDAQPVNGYWPGVAAGVIATVAGAAVSRQAQAAKVVRVTS